jgi:hypothetical protein
MLWARDTPSGTGRVIALVMVLAALSPGKARSGKKRQREASGKKTRRVTPRELIDEPERGMAPGPALCISQDNVRPAEVLARFFARILCFVSG